MGEEQENVKQEEEISLFEDAATENKEDDMQFGKMAVDESDFEEMQSSSEEKPVDNDTKRYEYWQSEADKRGNRINKLEKELQASRELEPYARLVRENPDILKNIGDKGNNGQPELTPPKPPEKPNDFNELDAINDPESKSAAYQRKLAEYQSEATLYNQQRLDNFLTQQQEKDKQVQIAQERNQQQNSWRETLSSKYNFNSKEADSFINEMYSQSSMNEENLVKLFLLNHPEVVENHKNSKQMKASKKNLVNQKVNQMNRKQANPTLATAGGEAEENKSEEQLFNEGLVGTGAGSLDY